LREAIGAGAEAVLLDGMSAEEARRLGRLRGGCGGIAWWRKRRKKRFNTEGTEEEHRDRRERQERWLCWPSGCRRYRFTKTDAHGLVELGMGK